MVSADIFRGRYRESFETPKAIAPDQPLPYRFALPTANHVFLPGHRIMVQVQSSWFPLYDRNPQTFVPNIFWAKPADYQQGDAADLSRAGPGELHRAAGRDTIRRNRGGRKERRESAEKHVWFFSASFAVSAVKQRRSRSVIKQRLF